MIDKILVIMLIVNLIFYIFESSKIKKFISESKKNQELLIRLVIDIDRVKPPMHYDCKCVSVSEMATEIPKRY